MGSNEARNIKMKDSLEKKLVKDFPHVFYPVINAKRTPLGLFGIECGDGWEPSIRKIAEKLEPLFKKAIKEDPTGRYKYGFYRTSQIKEKFGIGCWYLSGGTAEMQKLVEAWTMETRTICEVCGGEGKLRGTDWLYTACLEHTDLRHLDNLDKVELAAKKLKLRRKK